MSKSTSPAVVCTKVSLELFEVLNAFVLVVDSENVVRQATRFTTRLLTGKNPLVGTKLATYLLQGESAHLRLSGTYGMPKIVEVKLHTGEIRKFEFTAQPAHTAPEATVLFGTDVTEILELKYSLQELYHRDLLTGLGNRNLADSVVDDLLIQSKLTNTPFCVLLIDLDGFKHVNDSRGHKAGDALLQAISRRLRCAVAPSDTLARLGGDEFLVVLPGVATEAAARRFGGYLSQALALPCDIDGVPARVTASIGMAITSPSVTTTDHLLSNADMAMYLAKSYGRNQLVIFSEGMEMPPPAPFELGQLMAESVTTGDFYLAYQPIMDPQSNSIRGVEALMRWSTQGKDISPAEFIPVAEANGHIQSLGSWAMHAACSQLRAWDKAGLAVPYVAVNVSPLQFSNPNFIATVHSALASSNMPPERLVLEITEGVLMRDTSSALETLRQLVSLGVRLALDDFGTGYSSLAYLNRFPVSTIKLDRSFVTAMLDSPQGLTVVKAIIDLARELGMGTVAEGVETQAQADVLVDNGCLAIQGWLYSKALTGEKFLDMATAKQYSSFSRQ